MALLEWLPAISDIGEILSLERPSSPLELHSVLLAGDLLRLAEMKAPHAATAG